MIFLISHAKKVEKDIDLVDRKFYKELNSEPAYNFDDEGEYLADQDYKANIMNDECSKCDRYDCKFNCN